MVQAPGCGVWADESPAKSIVDATTPDAKAKPSMPQSGEKVVYFILSILNLNEFDVYRWLQHLAIVLATRNHHLRRSISIMFTYLIRVVFEQ